MPEITSDERKRIYEEEKAKLEAQEKIKEEKKAKQQKNTGIGCLVIIIIIGILWITGIFKSEKKSPAPSKPLYVDLNAEVRFTGTQFIISNKDAFNWTNVELEINSGILKSGYKLTTLLIEAGNTYTVGALQFAKPDGTRFNPFQIKPQSFTITCNTPKGKGLYSGGWK